MKFIVSNKYLILSLAIIAFIAGFNTFDIKLAPSSDAATYYLLGKALVSGEGYVEIWKPDSPREYSFPFMYPLMISIVQYIFPENINVIKIINILLFSFIPILTFILMERTGAKKLYSYGAGLLVAVNVYFLDYSSWMLSEIPFTLFSLLYLITIIRIGESPNSRYLMGVTLPILLFGIAFYTRIAGLPLAISGLIYLIYIGKKRHALILAIGIVPIIMSWFIYGSLNNGSENLITIFQNNPFDSSSPILSLSRMSIRFLNNTLHYLFYVFPETIFPAINGGIISILSSVVMITAMIIGIFHLNQASKLLLFYITIYLIMLGLFPHFPAHSIRLLMPLIPILIGLFIAGVGYGMMLIPIDTKRGLQILIIILLIMVIFQINPFLEHREIAIMAYPDEWKNYIGMAIWAKENLEKGSIVACNIPQVFSLFSGHKTVGYVPSNNEKEVINNLVSVGADYLLIDSLGFPLTKRYIIPAMEKFPPLFKQVAESITSPTTRLFKIRRELVPYVK